MFRRFILEVLDVKCDSKAFLFSCVNRYIQNEKQGHNPLGRESNDISIFDMLQPKYRPVFEHKGFYVFDDGINLYGVTTSDCFLNDWYHPWMVQLTITEPKG